MAQHAIVRFEKHKDNPARPLEALIVTKATQQQSQHCDDTGNAV